MATSKKAYIFPSAHIREEDATFLSKEAKKERWGLLPQKSHSSPGDDQDCVGCPIWIRWACIKCGTCMYWLKEEEENH
jgi:hypothetical protein